MSALLGIGDCEYFGLFVAWIELIALSGLGVLRLVLLPQETTSGNLYISSIIPTLLGRMEISMLFDLLIFFRFLVPGEPGLSHRVGRKSSGYQSITGSFIPDHPDPPCSTAVSHGSWAALMRCSCVLVSG